MKNFSSLNANNLFDELIFKYHHIDSIHQEYINPYTDRLDALLYEKCWIDTVQWHVEDLIRDPDIEPLKGIEYKRLIDRLNQRRTDKVEQLDDFFLEKYKDINYSEEAKINSESPAWAIDRLSILALKIFHMKIEASRTDIDAQKKMICQQKLDLLLEQRIDLSTSIDELLADIANGVKKMKVYRQLKMYNDPQLNPILYKKSK